VPAPHTISFSKTPKLELLNKRPVSTFYLDCPKSVTVHCVRLWLNRQSFENFDGGFGANRIDSNFTELYGFVFSLPVEKKSKFVIEYNHDSHAN
jgi:hypothetical protein